MTLPGPFQSLLDEWHRKGTQVLHADWTTSLHRHVGAKVRWYGKICYAKLALANQRDLDEPNMLDGMRREVWWSHVIRKLRLETPKIPFTAPQIHATNVNKEPYQDDVAWIIMEYIDGQPIVDWEPEGTERQLTSTETEQFSQLLNAVINSLLVLEQIHPITLENFGLPPLPAPPHGTRRWQEKGLLDIEKAALGNGAFEIKNFWRTPDNQLVILDNEFAGWYPRYDHLSYLYHRLYCNSMRPDLAKQLLQNYLNRAFVPFDRIIRCEKPVFDFKKEFLKDFSRLLRPRLLDGLYYDTVRRKLPPWHRKQRLRYELLWQLQRRRYCRLSH